MYAKSLEDLLERLTSKADIVNSQDGAMAVRFTSLRNFGQLPRGRDQRSKPLDNIQVANAILGLVCAQPTWAGPTSTSLARLRAVGGPESSHLAAETLVEALVSCITNRQMCETVQSVTLTSAETGTNSHGFATIAFADPQRVPAWFVPPEAASLMQPGAQLTFNPASRRPIAAQELCLSKKFFSELSRSVTDARRFEFAPLGPGDEYDTEDAEVARKSRLNITPRSRFLHLSADNHVTWPRTETLVHFDGHTLVCMPKTRDHVQSIHIDLHANSLTIQAAQSLASRFMSALAWHDDHFAVLGFGWAGNPVPVPVAKTNLAFTTATNWFMPAVPLNHDARLAMALYREGRNAKSNQLPSFAIISFFKIIEMRYPSVGKLPHVREFLDAEFENAVAFEPGSSSIARLRAAAGADSPAKYLTETCRNAVAHTSIHTGSNPDDATETLRLIDAADVMRLMARRFMYTELGFPDE